ncbi:putative p-type atpase [Diaporthe ampelina]|uniref:Putative P-type atpase n=1 Tax=Diaporthe ampelina TaxID=1214573 RepID=A0A0G2H975_9PEZI|nr:putative p-type atpase [Diaporthe ampelina]
MGFYLYDQLLGLLIFFSVLCTITVGLRVLVRTKLTKGAFGWDDVALVFSYVGMIVFVALCILAYDFAKYVVCFVISGTVKISVALVLYRLDSRPKVRTIILIDIITCTIWNVVTTLVLSLGCMRLSPYVISDTVCENTLYSQESSYVIYDVFHVLLPIYILWNVQISKALKVSVVALFGVGLLAAVAAVMKLQVHHEQFHPRDNNSVSTWYLAMIWAITEHGLSIFASSVLALRPLARFVSKGWASISSNLYGGSSKDAKSSGQGTSTRVSKKSNWSEPTESNELGSIGVRNDVSVHSEYTLEGHAQQPLYLAEAYNGSSDSHKRLVEAKTHEDRGVSA